MEYYCNLTNDELKFLKDEFDNIEGGTTIKSSFFTYRQPNEYDEFDVYKEYNGERHGWIIPQESRDSIENVRIFDINERKIKEGVKNPLNSGSYDVLLDVLSCKTYKSRLYFTFKLFKENCYISSFQSRNVTTTPKKKFRNL